MRECICGKKMIPLIIGYPFNNKKLGSIKIWVCPTDGCGRIFMEGSETSTWYTAEKNERESVL